MVGAALPIVDGYLVNLRMTAPPRPYETPEGHLGVWKRGYMQLKGSLDYKDLYCCCPSQSQGYAVLNNSLPFRGQLVVVAVPRGSTWSLTLSDVPNVRKAA
jgi:hypothetical protein